MLPGSSKRLRDSLSVVHQDDRGFVVREFQNVFSGHSQFDFTKRIVRPDGAVRHVRCVGAPSRGTISRNFVGTGIDVTEQVALTQELQLRDMYLAEAQRLSRTGSFGWNPHKGQLVWSEETYRIFEYDPAEKPTLEMVLARIHPDDRTLAQEIIAHASETGNDFELEHRLLMPSSAIKHLHVRAQSRRDHSGDTEFVGAVTDITERKSAEERVREQETELRLMLDLTPQLVAVFGPKGERRYANRGALAYLGMDLEGWRRGEVGDQLHPDDAEQVRGCWERALSDGAASELELRVRRWDGDYRWFLARCNPVQDDRGQISGWYFACTDIDDRKRDEERLRQENLALREEVDQASMFEEIVGNSSNLAAVLGRISKVATSDSTVLVSGETGTGKELVARAIHRRSNRSSRPFISVNCAAIPRDLILSELFGHEKGAFTGALQRRIGRFELANGGTIFLDEVGELSLDSQVALLRVLQEREVERVGGGGQPIRIDVRVIAATNRDMDLAIANGTFRRDLFYRLNVFPIMVPPLRERKDDILMLVEYFLQRYASKAGKKIRSVAKKTLNALESYDWPGNIRELQNVIERSVILSAGDVLSVEESWLSHGNTPPLARTEPPGAKSPERRSEREIIENALAETRGRVSGPSGAAVKLGIRASTLATRIRALKIDKLQFKFR
jgi:PAS domain S-box-containing protein